MANVDSKKVTATVMVLPQKDYTRKEQIIIAYVICQRNTGKDLDFYAYLMRKSMVSDNRRDKVNPSATKLLLGHQSENVAGRWYASADDEEVLNLVYSRAYKHKKDYE